MADSTPSTPVRVALPDLALPVRLVLAVFLLSVGLGYVSALVNLHFQEATPGELLPTGDDVKSAYHGQASMSQFERLLRRSDTSPFNGQGSMRAAFTKRVGGMASLLKNKAKKLKLDLDKPADLARANKEVLKDLDGERVALILWVMNNPQQEQYDADAFELPEKYKDLQITAKYLKDDKEPVAGEDKPKSGRVVSIKSILDDRCVRCHSENVGGAAANFPLDNWEELASYQKKEGPTGKSLMKLALTTHVHLLGFSMLYGLTGLIFAFSSYPVWMRVLLAPAALVAQMVDISFWWLARLDEPYGPMLAEAIRVTGGVVALSLGLQILLSLFNLFKVWGRVVLVLLFALAIGGAYCAKTKIIDPYLAIERGHPSVREEVHPPNEPPGQVQAP